MEPGLLLIPGPVPLPPRVLEELAKPAMPHYGDAWVKAHGETREMLRYLWSSGDGHVLPIAGPGHAGIEALAYTFLRPGDRVVVVSNGFFGERLREVLQAHRLKADVVESAWGSGPDPDGLRTALKQPTKAVAVVHNETSTGVTNPLEGIVECAHAVGAFASGHAGLVSSTVTCMSPPGTIGANTLVQRLRLEHNITISGGLGPLRGKTIRIGTMGTQAEPDVIDRLLEAVRSIV